MTFKSTLLAVLLFSPLLSSHYISACDQTGGGKPPNIVFLLTDDQATITLGCYGNEAVRTPNLDDLASKGVIFDRHYVTTAICMASRANIFTGLYEYRTGCNFTTGNLPRAIWNDSYPMRFRASGYRTAFAGKFGITIEGEKDLPLNDFDRWGGGPDQTSYQTSKNLSMQKYAEEYPHSTRSYAAFARDFMQESVTDNKPFCLSISFKASHRPVTPDPIFDEVYQDTVFKKPENFGRSQGQHLAPQSKTGRQYPRFKSWGYADSYDAVMRKYNQQIFGVDFAVGQIRAEIERLGITDNTIIVFTSDNGFMCGSHGYGSKVIPYEESARVPLIIFDPRHQSSGKNIRCKSLTGSIDLCPTLLELSGLAPIENIDGVSLLPLLDAPESTVRESLALMNFWGPETTHSYGVVTNRWKYLYWYSQANGMSSTEELFDLHSDGSELTNAAMDDQHQARLESMRRRYDDHVYDIERNAINTTYKKYGVLFDRKKSWQEKSELLPSKTRK